MEYFAGPLTILLWLFSIVTGAIGFSKVRRGRENWMAFTMRVAFGVGLALSIWLVASYVFWLADINLKIGTVIEGKMAENWWLPFVAVALTYLAFKTIHQGARSDD